jgi:hypothetical protein
MGVPRKLKVMTVFHNGTAYLGETTSVTLPKLARKFEGYRGGGMDGPTPVDLGMDGLMELEHNYGGFMREYYRSFGIAEMGGEQLRFVGSFQSDGDGAITKVEVTMRGRHQELDSGENKPGEETEFKVKTALSYYKLEVDGVVETEIDPVNMVLITGGVDRMAGHRAVLGV